jgi:hypothetical protein
MRKTVLYQYMGTNGIILSPIHLEDVYYIRKVKLVAEPGYLLTNGIVTQKAITVPEADVELWKEVLDNGQM